MTATWCIKNPVGKDAVSVWGCIVVQASVNNMNPVYKQRKQHEGERDGGRAKKGVKPSEVLYVCFCV